MPDDPDVPDATQNEGGLELAADRRRPGRPRDVPDTLVPLLRGAVPLEDDLAAPEFDLEALLARQEDNADPMAPGRGIMLGLLLAVPFWTMLGLGVYWLRS